MTFNLAEKLRQKPAINVDISAIEIDDLGFAVSTTGELTGLINSVKFAGLLHPVWLTPQGSGYLIVSGFRRVRACLALKRETILAMVLDEAFTDSELATLAVMDNLGTRVLNPVEEARALALIRKYAQSENELRATLQNLGLSQNPKHIAKLEKLLQLPAATQEAVARDVISLAVAEDLAAFDAEIALSFTEIFVSGKVGLNRQREFIRLVFELARIKHVPTADIFKLPEFNDLWRAVSDDRRQKALLLLDWLYRERYPVISAVRDHARQKIAALKLDNRLRLNMPENFENLRHSLSFNFENRDELLELLDLCLKLAHDPAVGDLFKREEV